MSLGVENMSFYVFDGALTGPDPRRAPPGPRGGPDPRRAPLGPRAPQGPIPAGPHQGPGPRRARCPQGPTRAQGRAQGRARSPQGPTRAQGPAGPDPRRVPPGPRGEPRAQGRAQGPGEGPPLSWWIYLRSLQAVCKVYNGLTESLRNHLATVFTSVYKCRRN